MPHAVICPDSFKGSATAAHVAAAIARGFHDEGWTTTQFPLADGGEGTAETLLPDAPIHTLPTTDAHGDPVTGVWRDPGVIDLASASGLPQVRRLSPELALAASTRGTGEVIVDVLRAGHRTIVLCLGGSATTDAGAGLVDVVTAEVPELLPGVTWRLLTDVTTSPRDCAAVFGPQKGMDAAAVDTATERILKRCDRAGVSPDEPRYGAAGATPVGIAGLVRGFGGSLSVEAGAPAVAREVGLLDALPMANVVVTGEGSVDKQSLSGKVVSYVASVSPAPLLLIAGRIDVEAARALGAKDFRELSGDLAATEHDLTMAARDLAAAYTRCVARADEEH